MSVYFSISKQAAEPSFFISRIESEGINIIRYSNFDGDLSDIIIGARSIKVGIIIPPDKNSFSNYGDDIDDEGRILLFDIFVGKGNYIETQELLRQQIPCFIYKNSKLYRIVKTSVVENNWQTHYATLICIPLGDTSNMTSIKHIFASSVNHPEDFLENDNDTNHVEQSTEFLL